MEYVYFVIFIAAGGAILALCWHAVDFARTKRISMFATQRKRNLARKPGPPLKKAINSLPNIELEHIEFRERIDVWQKEHDVRRSWFNQYTEPLTGKKYTYEPPQKNRASATNR